jgi:hypothetical protein
LCIKDGRRAQISRVGHELLYEIHPRLFFVAVDSFIYCAKAAPSYPSKLCRTFLACYNSPL